MDSVGEPTVPERFRPITNYPFLVNLSALRASNAARESLNIDVLTDAFDATTDDGGSDKMSESGGSDVRAHGAAGSPTQDADEDANDADADGDAQFGAQMRARLADLGDRALETRELASHLASMRELIANAPTSSQYREWAHATSAAIRRAESAMEIGGGAGNSDDAARSAETDAVRLCDKLDAASTATTALLADACTPVENKLAKNYAWIRAQSTMLGIHGCTRARCPVCLVKQVTTFIDPCGHTFCDSCLARSGDDTCCICRGAIRAKRKLFWCG